MVRALRVMTVEQGLDPRDFALLAFGGAGGLHAIAIAEELGMRRVLVPRAGGVLSALGLAAADRRVQLQRTVLGSPYETAAEDLAAEARERLGAPDAAVETVYDCRYHGQSFELTVDDPAAFPVEHEERYGFREEDGEIEIVTVRVTRPAARPARRARRRARPPPRAQHVGRRRWARPRDRSRRRARRGPPRSPGRRSSPPPRVDGRRARRLQSRVDAPARSCEGG
jgi:N-methylhydantoinase A/oxoprolinase/acetone carboxylase beta subunit